MWKFTGTIFWFKEKVTGTSLADTPGIGTLEKVVTRGLINGIRCIL